MTNARKVKPLLSLTGAACLLLAQGPAHATPVVEFSVNGTTAATFGDGDSEDNDPSSNVLSLTAEPVTGPGGTTFDVDITSVEESADTTTGVSQLIEGINISATSSVSPGDTLGISATGDFTVPAGTSPPPRTATSTISPSVLGDFSLEFGTSVDGDQVLSTQLVPETPPTTVATEQVSISSNPFQVTQEGVLTAENGVSGNSDATFDADTTVSVPLPATVGFLGVGLITLGVAVRGRRAA